MTEFTIYDYKGNEKVVELDLSKISVIMKYVVSRSEVLEVFYKDGDRQLIDSINCYPKIKRIVFFEECELIYSSDIPVERGIKMTEFTIYDYKGNEKVVELDLSKISVIMKYVSLDDEFLEVFYKNGDRQVIDSLQYSHEPRMLHTCEESELIYSSDMEYCK